MHFRVGGSIVLDLHACSRFDARPEEAVETQLSGVTIRGQGLCGVVVLVCRCNDAGWVRWGTAYDHERGDS